MGNDSESPGGLSHILCILLDLSVPTTRYWVLLKKHMAAENSTYVVTTGMTNLGPISAGCHQKVFSIAVAW